MDIARPDLAKKKRRKMTLYVGIGVVAVVIASIAISSLKPAAPAIDRNLVWVDTVKRGPMVRQVRGIGSLVPENIRIVTSRSAGRVDRIVLRAGAPVTPDSIIVELANPEAAPGEGTVAGGEVGRRDHTEDDADRLQGCVDGVDSGLGQGADEGAQLGGGASFDEGDLDERHPHSPPLR